MIKRTIPTLYANLLIGKTGRLTKITNNLVGTGNKNRTYDYDGIGRLKTAKGGATGTLWTQTYSHDRLGNRTNVVATGNAAGTGGAMPTDGLPTTANYESASNRLTSIVPNASTGINPANPNFEYDPTGNQTRVIQSNGVAQRYCYDAAGRLSQVKADDNTTMVASYGYGASNQRLKQTEYVSGVGTTICYAWSGSSIIGEYLDNGSLVWQKCYVYLGGRLLSTQVLGTAANATQYHHPDRLGTRVISNAGDLGYSENAVLPYGTAIDAESAGTTTNRRFTSYDRSSVTKLDYAVNRFYDCKQGRFTQVDPIGMSAASLGDPQSLNLYAYVGNDPINRTDPSGLFWKKLFNIFKIALRVIAIVAAVAVILALSWGISSVVVFGLEFKLWQVALMAAGALAASFGAGKLGALLGGIAGAAAGAVNFRTPGINGNSGVSGVSNFLQQGSAGKGTNRQPWVVSDFWTLYEQVRTGKKKPEVNDKNKAECALLPQKWTEGKGGQSYVMADWRAGASLTARPQLAVGTVIATFGSDGRYTGNHQHTAIFVSYYKGLAQDGKTVLDGVYIIDQYPGFGPELHFIPFSKDAPYFRNASSFSTTTVPKGSGGSGGSGGCD